MDNRVTSARMPLEPIDLQGFCTAERNAEEHEWHELLRAPIEDLLSRDQGAEAEVSADGKALCPRLPATFREGEKVAVVSDDAGLRTQRLGDALRGARTLFVEGVALDGRLLLGGRCPIDGAVLVLPTGPLLDLHRWHQGIVQRWLGVQDLCARAQQLKVILASSPADESSAPLKPSAEERKALLGEALSSPDALTLVQGPPGCGKTVLAADLIADALARGCSVGAWAFTNRACDGLLRTLHQRAPASASRALRFGNPAGQRRDLAPLGIGQATALSAMSGHVLGTTLFQVAKSTSRALEQGVPPQPFDIAFVDEGSQATLPMLVAALAVSRQLVLLGDQRQLGPVLKSDPSPEAPELHQSAFEFLARRRPAHFLAETRRMRPPVCRIVSEAFYEGKLTSGVAWEPPSSPRTRAEPFLQLDPGLELLEVPAGESAGWSPEREVAAVLDVARGWASEAGISLLAAAAEALGSPENEPHLLVSCFYRRQVLRLRKAFGEASGLAGLRIHVDTVERNQGASCLVSLLSVADDGSKGATRHSLDWRLDPRRLNVAVTRGRLKAFVFSSRGFLDLATGSENEVSRMAWRKIRGQA